MSAAVVVGVVGVLLNQVFIWPQVLRAVRTVEGVAALTVLAGLLARVLWTVYGAVLDDVALIVGNATVAAGFLTLVVLLVRRGRPVRGLVAGTALVVAVVVGATLAGNVVLGWVSVVAAAVVNLPQMVRALVDPERLAGVSVPTYLLIGAASASWLTYGVLTGEPLISAPHLVLLPTALVTAAAAWRSQRRHRAPVAALEGR